MFLAATKAQILHPITLFVAVFTFASGTKIQMNIPAALGTALDGGGSSCRCICICLSRQDAAVFFDVSQAVWS